MSSGDEPVGSGNRTVFRPSPLSGLGGAQPRPAPPPAAPPPSAPAPAAQPASASPALAPDRAAAAPPPPPSGPRLTDEGIPSPGIARETRAPMATEAGPVLALVASVRSGRARIAMRDFHREASAGLAEYDRAIAPHYSEEARRTARALLASTIDDIARNLPSLDGDEPWSGPSLASTFGVEVEEAHIWTAIDKALKDPKDPEDHSDLLELAHACIAAGFQGKYRTSSNGRAELNDLTTRIYGSLDHIKALSMRFVSPNWVGYDAPLRKVALFNIVALVVAGCLVLILAVYALLRVLGGAGEAASAQVAASAAPAFAAAAPATGARA